MESPPGDLRLQRTLQTSTGTFESISKSSAPVSYPILSVSNGAVSSRVMAAKEADSRLSVEGKSDEESMIVIREYGK